MRQRRNLQNSNFSSLVNSFPEALNVCTTCSKVGATVVENLLVIRRCIMSCIRFLKLFNEEEEEPYFVKNVPCLFVPLYPTYAPVSRSFGLRSSYESVSLTPTKDPRTKGIPVIIWVYRTPFLRTSRSLSP